MSRAPTTAPSEISARLSPTTRGRFGRPCHELEALGKFLVAGVDLVLSARAEQERPRAEGGRSAPRELETRTVRHLQDTYHTTLEALGSAIETRDVGTQAHSRRVRAVIRSPSREPHGVPESGELLRRPRRIVRAVSIPGACFYGIEVAPASRTS